MTKLRLDPNSPLTNFILGATLAGGDPMEAARMCSGARVERVQLGPVTIIREQEGVPPRCTATLAAPVASPIVGYGNTQREASKHLADKLREIARLVEAADNQGAGK